jgi:hypothetical protein
MHNSFMWLHTYPVCYLKLVKRCELELKQPAMQRVSSVQLVAPTHLLLSSYFHLDLDIYIKMKIAIIWCYQLAISVSRLLICL